MGKYVDSAAILQVLGCIFLKPSLLDNSDKYDLCKHDFVDKFHKVIYAAIFQLHDINHGGEITAVTISDYLKNKPDKLAIFEKNNGEKWLAEVREAAQLDAFDYYYGRVKKFSVLRAYKNYGIDVSDIYDDDEVFDIKKMRAQGQWLDDHSVVDIIKCIDDKIDRIKAEYASKEFKAPKQAGDNIFELLDFLKKNPDYGLPLYGGLVNTVSRGARLGKFYLRSAPSGCGKAIPNDTLIPTPIGWRKVGDIKEGDYLFGQDGRPTQVLKVHPQLEKKNIWKVYFSDGRVAQCCGEHLWKYKYKSHNGESYRVEDTQTIYERSLHLDGGFKNKGDKTGYSFRIDLNEPVYYKEKVYSLPPYVMGAFLGDGSLRYGQANKSLTFSSGSEELPSLIVKELGNDYCYQKNSRHNYNYSFKKIKNLGHPIWVEEFLKDYPALWNVKSEDKFIPEDYLMGSIQQRLALLQGLLDTDGSIDSKGRISFTTISPKLRDNLIELCYSLGFIATYIIDKREKKYTTGECYCIHIQCKKELKVKLFRLQKKLNKAIEYVNSKKRKEHKDSVAIIGIEKTEEKTNMTCFTVDNDSHLFLMNDYIVTHNTRTMVADAATMSCSQMWTADKGWQSLTAQQPTYYITTEQRLDEVQTMLLSFLAGVDEDKILEGHCDEEEENRLNVAAKVLSEAPLYIEEMPDFSMTDIENQIKLGIREHNAHYIFFDYIHSSVKILEEITRRTGGIKLREDNVLFMIAIRLKDICVENDVFLLSSTQLNGDWKTANEPDQNLLRGRL